MSILGLYTVGFYPAPVEAEGVEMMSKKGKAYHLIRHDTPIIIINLLTSDTVPEKFHTLREQ